MGGLVHKSKGKTLGVGICHWFYMVFRAQETLPNKLRRTDAVLAQMVEAEYPERSLGFSDGSSQKTINDYRQKYNNGKFSPPEKYPIDHVFSFRYDEEGRRVDPRHGVRILSQYEIYQIYQDWVDKHGQVVESIRA